MTDAEKRLWGRLRREALGYDFRRQHPLGAYVVDFVCLERKLIVEVDGGQHNFQPGLKSDALRTGWLNERGYTVLRFWNNDVLLRTDDVIETIWQALREPRKGLPSAKR